MQPAFGLIERLLLHARNRPDAVAVRGPAGHHASPPVTWRELCGRASAFARRLRDEPPASGVLMLEVDNHSPALAAMLGALWAGCDVLVVSPESAPGELRRLAERADASLLVVSASLSSSTQDWVGRRLVLGDAGDARADEEETFAPSVGTRLASLLLQSSGTEGASKIVRRPAPALDALARNVVDGIGIGTDDVMLMTIPLCHSYGIDLGLLAGIFAGASIELHQRFVPGLAASALDAGDVTLWPAVPLMLDAVSRNRPAHAGKPTTARVISAGSPLPARIHQQFEFAFGIRVGQLYGASEYGALSCADPSAPGFDPASVGRPFSNVEFRIVDPGRPSATEPLQVGVEGEVLVSSPSAMSGYLEDADASLDGGVRAGGVRAGEFLRSGDLGRLDSFGALFVTGRIKLLIDVGGRKVNPLEVEAVLAQHPEVAEAVVHGTAFSETAARLKAIVVAEPGTRPTAAALRTFALDHLAAYKVPRTFEIRTDVPRSAAGKILREQLALDRPLQTTDASVP